MAKSREIPASNRVIEFEAEAHLQNPAALASNSSSPERVLPKKSMAEPSSVVVNKVAAGMKRSATTSMQGTEKKSSKKKEGKHERVFSPEDDIVVLEELLKVYPIPIEKESPEMEHFYQLIKGGISVDVSKTQVIDKIRRLKNKFKKNANCHDNVDLDESEKDHKSIVYDLSRKIWGNEDRPKSVMNKGSTSKNDVSSSYEKRAVEEWIYREGTQLVAEEARGELEKKWKAMRREEARIFLEKLELSRKHAKIVYDAMSS